MVELDEIFHLTRRCQGEKWVTLLSPRYTGRNRRFSMILSDIIHISPLNPFGSALNYKSFDSPPEALQNGTITLSLICG